jgi:uncharacterized alkaline shock family protein YloU
MSISKETDLGNIKISEDAIATLAGGIVMESYGIVGMASQKILKDGLAELLGKENYSKGIVVRESTDKQLELDLYVIVGYGVKITEVVYEVQKKVKYVLEKTLEVKFKSVNVYVQGVRIIS